MKTKHLTSVSAAIATATAALLFAGCGTSSGYKQADKTGAGIAEFRAEIVNGKKAIDETMMAIDQIAMSANTNPRKAFETYAKSVSKLESTAATVRKRAQDMKDQGQAYFKQWEEQMAQVKNPEIQKLAKERKAKLQETFDNIKKFTEPLKAQFDPWMADLKDLQKYLSNDLTIAGVDAAKSLFAKAKAEGMDLQKAMDALIAELNTVAATLTPANMPPQSK